MRDEQGFADFASARTGVLRRQAYLLTGSAERAARLADRALAETARRWDKLGGPVAAEEHARRLVAAAAVRERSRGAAPAVAVTPVGTALPPAGDDAGEAVWRALAALPSRRRAVLVLRYEEGLDDIAVGARLGVPAAAAAAEGEAGLATLRSLLRRRGAPEDLLPAALTDPARDLPGRPGADGGPAAVARAGAVAGDAVAGDAAAGDATRPAGTPVPPGDRPGAAAGGPPAAGTAASGAAGTGSIGAAGTAGGPAAGRAPGGTPPRPATASSSALGAEATTETAETTEATETAAMTPTTSAEAGAPAGAAAGGGPADVIPGGGGPSGTSGAAGRSAPGPAVAATSPAGGTTTGTTTGTATGGTTGTTAGRRRRWLLVAAALLAVLAIAAAALVTLLDDGDPSGAAAEEVPGGAPTGQGQLDWSARGPLAGDQALLRSALQAWRAGVPQAQRPAEAAVLYAGAPDGARSVLLQGTDPTGQAWTAQVTEDAGTLSLRAAEPLGRAAPLLAVGAGDDRVRVLTPAGPGTGLLAAEGSALRPLSLDADGLSEPVTPAVAGLPLVLTTAGAVAGSGTLMPGRLSAGTGTVEIAAGDLDLGPAGPPTAAWYGDGALLVRRLGGPVTVAAAGPVRTITVRVAGRPTRLEARAYEAVRAGTHYLASVVRVSGVPACVDVTRRAPAGADPARPPVLVSRCRPSRAREGVLHAVGGAGIRSVRVRLPGAARGRPGQVVTITGASGAGLVGLVAVPGLVAGAAPAEARAADGRVVARVVVPADRGPRA